MKKIEFEFLANDHLSLSDLEYEDYLEDNMEYVIGFDEALENGDVTVITLTYFLKDPTWKLCDKRSRVLEKTFYVPNTIPRQYFTLEIDMDTRRMKYGKCCTIGDYDMVLSMEVKKSLIPLLETEIINY